MLRVMLTDTVHERIALGIGQRRRKERHDLFVRIDGAKRYAVFLAPLTQAQASGGDRFHVQQAPSLRIFGFQRVRGHTTSRPVTDAQSPSVKALEPTCSMARRQAIMPPLSGRVELFSTSPGGNGWVAQSSAHESAAETRMPCSEGLPE
jgi:hypothetical protein